MGRMSSIIHSSVCEQELRTDEKLYLMCTGNTTCQCTTYEGFSLYRITEPFHFPVYVSQGKDPVTFDLPSWYSEYSTNLRNCGPVLNYNESNCCTSVCMCNFGPSYVGFYRHPLSDCEMVQNACPIEYNKPMK